MRSQDVSLLDIACAQPSSPPEAAILAPLDNLLWDRRFIKELFDFYYVWEVYKPVKERLYGYYVLPVLYGDHFIARFEPGRDKESGALVIKNWWWEESVEATEQVLDAVNGSLVRLAKSIGVESAKLMNPST